MDQVAEPGIRGPANGAEHNVAAQVVGNGAGHLFDLLDSGSSDSPGLLVSSGGSAGSEGAWGTPYFAAATAAPAALAAPAVAPPATLQVVDSALSLSGGHSLEKDNAALTPTQVEAAYDDEDDRINRIMSAMVDSVASDDSSRGLEYSFQALSLRPAVAPRDQVAGRPPGLIIQTANLGPGVAHGTLTTHSPHSGDQRDPRPASSVSRCSSAAVSGGSKRHHARHQVPFISKSPRDSMVLTNGHFEVDSGRPLRPLGATASSDADSTVRSPNEPPRDRLQPASQTTAPQRSSGSMRHPTLSFISFTDRHCPAATSHAIHGIAAAPGKVDSSQRQGSWSHGPATTVADPQNVPQRFGFKSTVSFSRTQRHKMALQQAETRSAAARMHQQQVYPLPADFAAAPVVQPLQNAAPSLVPYYEHPQLRAQAHVPHRRHLPQHAHRNHRDSSFHPVIMVNDPIFNHSGATVSPLEQFRPLSAPAVTNHNLDWGSPT